MVCLCLFLVFKFALISEATEYKIKKKILLRPCPLFLKVLCILMSLLSLSIYRFFSLKVEHVNE